MYNLQYDSSTVSTLFSLSNYLFIVTLWLCVVICGLTINMSCMNANTWGCCFSSKNNAVQDGFLRGGAHRGQPAVWDYIRLGCCCCLGNVFLLLGWRFLTGSGISCSVFNLIRYNKNIISLAVQSWAFSHISHDPTLLTTGSLNQRLTVVSGGEYWSGEVFSLWGPPWRPLEKEGLQPSGVL